jgi:hypothetical protein
MSPDSRDCIGCGGRKDVVKDMNARSGDDVRIKHYIHTLGYDYSTVDAVIRRKEYK